MNKRLLMMKIKQFIIFSLLLCFSQTGLAKKYPLQLTAGAEYVIDLVKDIDKAAIPYEDVKTYVYKPLGAKRDGINVYAGFRICL